MGRLKEDDTKEGRWQQIQAEVSGMAIWEGHERILEHAAWAMQQAKEQKAKDVELARNHGRSGLPKRERKDREDSTDTSTGKKKVWTPW